MKKTLFIVGLLILSFSGGFAQTAGEENLFQKCKNLAGSEAIYLKDFVVKFPAVREGHPPLVSRNSVMLSKNIRYRFSVCNSDQYNGVAVIQLFDDQKMLLSNYNQKTGKFYPFFDFVCMKTGRYHILISFKEGEAGEAVGIMSYIRQ